MGPRGRAPEAHPHGRLRRPDLRFPHHGRTRQRPFERRVRRQISPRPRRTQGQMPSHVRHRRARRRSDHPCRRLEDRPYLTEPRAAPQRGKFPSLRSSARGSWDYPILGFFGLPVSHWRPVLSSLFPEFYDRALGQLVLARKTARVTQASPAATLGRPQSFVAKYESRERRLDVAEFVGIARALGADPVKLLKATEKEQS